MLEVRYLDAARADLDAAVSWHETQRSRDTASRFLEEIGASIERIAALPLAWPISKLDPRVRVRQLRRIRYAIFYVLAAEAVTVVAIAHTSRRPGYWLDRIR
jgi:plasmid stabilization system protein ParE